MASHEQRLSLKSGEAETLSVTWPPLSSAQHNVWLIAALKLRIWSSWKALWTRHTQQHISSQSCTKEEKECTDAGELSSWISGWVFFPFILLSTACLILIKPILHSCLFVFHWIGWRYLLHSLTLREQAKSFQFKCKTVNFGHIIMFLIWKKWEKGNKERCTNSPSVFLWKNCSANLTSPKDSGVETPG